MLRFLIPLLLTASLAHAQAAQQDVGAKLQQLMRKNKGQTDIGQVLATGTLLGCTQKQVGKEATQAFYQEMETVGKAVRQYCREGHAAEARALTLSTLDAKKDDATVKAALNCYHTNQANLEKLAGPQISAEAARYARWIENPALAKTEVTEAEICKNKPQIKGATHGL